MDLSGIKSQDLSIDDLFKDFYEVPDYQREYVWSSEQVERLLSDVFNEFDQGKSDAKSDYFIGTIVTNFRADEKLYELIDGQQRITTAYVFLIALRDYLDELKSTMDSLKKQLYDFSVDSLGQEKKRYRVNLQYEDSQDVLKKLALDRDIVTVDELPSSTKSAENLLQAYKDCRAFLIESFDDGSDELRKFYAYFTQKVKLIRIRTESVDRALWIFETINDRGTSLDSMDLLKNLLFRNAEAREFQKLKERWKALTDTLFAAREKPIGFIRYYLLAQYAKDKLTADQVYSWLVDPKNQHAPDFKTDPVEFANELLSAARAYVNFIDGKTEFNNPCESLTNIWHLSHSARQHLVILLASRKLPEKDFVRLADEVEKLYAVFSITKQSSNKFEKMVVQWATQLRGMSTSEQLDVFLSEVLIPRRHSYSKEFEYRLRDLKETDLPKYRMKYVLGKLAQALDQAAFGWRELDVYVGRNFEIEHILPQVANAESISEYWGPSEAEEVINKLSNLTLLERPINATISNKPFNEKADGYRKSNTLLTRSLVSGAEIGNDTSINRALRHLRSYEKWGPDELSDREGRLLILARAIWDVPEIDEHSRESGINSDAAQ